MRTRWKFWHRTVIDETREFIIVTVFLLLAAGMVGFGLTDLRPALDAAQGKGTLGTFHVTSISCKKSQDCTVYGHFISDAGSVDRSNMRWLDGASANVQVGDDLRALDTGDRAGVFRPAGSRQWVMLTIVVAIGGLIALGLLSLFMVLIVRRLRLPPAAKIDNHGNGSMPDDSHQARSYSNEVQQP